MRSGFWSFLLLRRHTKTGGNEVSVGKAGLDKKMPSVSAKPFLIRDTSTYNFTNSLKTVCEPQLLPTVMLTNINSV